MNRMMKMATGILLTSTLVLGLVGCGGKKENGGAGGLTGTVTASGSTALLPLVTAAQEAFEDQQPDVTINVSGGGSFNGLTQVASGAVQIGNSDVEATGDTAKGLVDHKVAVAPFMIIINKDVTTTDVTMDQLAKIFRGEITNWKDVGGKDAKITVISRQQSSGSRATILATVLKGQGDITKDAIVQDSNGKVLEGVTTTPGAIGYVDAPYYSAEKVGALKIDGVAYSADAVTSGKWPIFAYGHMYTKGEPTGATKAFLDFIMSKEFQESTVAKLGFIPVSRMAK
ncbi:MAG TPA: phosphate ABC transporter substrate-binding protein [Symbiobacteriaceae bacterium]|jgi:phosphate transport system substrate-binding protein|nr:phosphate ABC transporter substrate-binding protein [Symbiobacteriaceae bacterium]